jgi:hypothetical protein
MSNPHPTVASFDAFLNALPMSEQDIPEGMCEVINTLRRFMEKNNPLLVTDYRLGTDIPLKEWVATVERECSTMRPHTFNEVPSSTGYMTAIFTRFGQRWETRRLRDRTDSYLRSCSEVVAIYMMRTSDHRPRITVNAKYLKRE